MKFNPHGYQTYCERRIEGDNAVGLFLDMGLGKTAIALTAVKRLKYERFAIRKTLVIAPKKVAETTWSKEAEKWDHLRCLKIVQVLGSLKKRVQAVNTPGDVYVINRENVVWLADYFKNNWPFDMVIVDELSSFKSRQAKRWRALVRMRPHISRIVGLTGTPAPNGLIDLWAQVYLLDGGQRLGKTITGFRERYFDPDKRGRDCIYSYKPKPGADETIRGLIGDICISMKSEDYLQLPECITTDIHVQLDPRARKAYDRLEREALLQVDESTIDATTAAVLSTKLLQLCNGAVYDSNGNIIEIHKCKLEALQECVEGLNGQHAIVFYSFRHDIPRIKNTLRKMELVIRELKTPQDEDDWNRGKIDILLAHPASAAYGLNLQDGGHHVIWFGLDWSLEKYQQANKRLHRQGQQHTVVIHHLAVEGSRDEDVISALADKEHTQNALMDALKVRIRKAKGELS